MALLPRCGLSPPHLLVERYDATGGRARDPHRGAHDHGVLGHVDGGDGGIWRAGEVQQRIRRGAAANVVSPAFPS